MFSGTTEDGTVTYFQRLLIQGKVRCK